jgi:uncharacterized protein (TIGR02266 family)
MSFCYGAVQGTDFAGGSTRTIRRTVRTHTNRRHLLVTLKQELQDVTQRLLGDGVSSIFLEKCLATIKDSADDRASLLAAADSVARRINLFIDQKLAERVLESFKAKLDSAAPASRAVRKHRRVNVSATVTVSHNGSSCALEMQNLSVGGMYLKTDTPFPKGSVIHMSLPLDKNQPISLKGVVVYSKDANGTTAKNPAGMGIQFEKIREKEFTILRDYLDNVCARHRVENGN